MTVGEPDTDALARIGSEITAVARADPDRPAVVSDHGELSFAELDARADALAATFAAAGFEPNDVVAVLCTNRPEYIVTMQAALRSGLRLVPVNWHLGADDIAYVINDSGARALIAEASFVHDLGTDVKGPDLRVSVGGSVAGYRDFAELVAADGADAPTRPRGSLMIYTSGTTGRPKGVRLDGEPTSDGSAIGAAMVAMFGMDGDRGDSMLCPAPLYHSGPSRICAEWPLGAGLTVHLMNRFDPRAALELIERHGITHAFFVPTMFQRMLDLADHDRFDVSTLTFVLHGAGPCPAATKHRMFEWFGPIIHEMYASTEGPGTWIGPEEWLAHPGSVGRTDPARLQIRTDIGEVAAPGEDGTVWNRSSAPFHYHGDADKTAATFDRSGEWYTVGDRGHVDDDGYLFLTGRTAECIVSGGVNIYPARIDEALAEHPEVADGAAFGVPDTDLGEVVAAAIVPVEPSDTADLAESVIEHCRATLGSQLTPRHVHIVDSLPRTEAGKLYRHRLVDRFGGP